jgi:hypothetical protein
MTIVPASRLSRADLCRLGNNVESVVLRDRSELAAINRSLSIHDEAVDEVVVPVRFNRNDDASGQLCLAS